MSKNTNTVNTVSATKATAVKETVIVTEPLKEKFATTSNITDLLKVKASECKQGYKFSPISKAEWEKVGLNNSDRELYLHNMDVFRVAVLNYKYDKGAKVTVKKLDGQLGRILEKLGIDEETRKSIIATMGNYSELVPARYGQVKTIEGKEKAKEIRTAYEKNIAKGMDIEKAEKIRREAMKELNNSDVFELNAYNEISSASFRRQVEHVIAYKLANIELIKEGKLSTDTAKWNRLIESARKWKVSEKTIEQCKNTADLERLRNARDKAMNSKVK